MRKIIFLLYLITFCLISFSMNKNNSSTILEHQFNWSDSILKLKRIGEVVPSPDGKQVIFTAFSAQETKNHKKTWHYSLYLYDENSKLHLLKQGSPLKQLDWYDNKTISYLGHGQLFQSIWQFNLENYQEQKVLELNTDIHIYKWSPHGNYLALLASGKDSSQVQDIIAKNVASDYQNENLFLVSLKNNQKPKLITVPKLTIADFNWAPDEQNLVISYQVGRRHPDNNLNKLALIDIKTTRQTEILYTLKHPALQPRFSPNGKLIAFVSNLEPSAYATLLNNDVNLNNRICIFNIETKQTQCLKNTFNENPVLLGWSPTNKAIFAMDNHKTIGYQLYKIPLNPIEIIENISNVNGFIEPLTVTLNKNNTTFGFGYETEEEAPQAYISSTQHFKLSPISHFKPPITKVSGETKLIHWKSFDGKNMEGLLSVPNSYQSSKKYPLFVAVHGGPAQAWAKRYLGSCDDYAEMTDPTSCVGNLLHKGFIVFQPNPRGSTGYGRAFRLANFKDLGGADYQDIMTGVKTLIQKNIVDSNHMTIGGWSFGGYMTAWIISHNNDFKAAIEGDGNTNLISFSGTTDIPNYYTEYFGAPFWQSNTLYLARSPISYVQNIHTPLLIIGGEQDERVPISQGYELYNALALQKRNVKMLALKNQGHVPTDPNAIALSLINIENWLNQATAKK